MNTKLKKSAKLVIILLILLALTSLQIFHIYLHGPSLIQSIISVLIVIIAFYLILTLETQYFFISFLLLFSAVNVVISCLIIEAGAYMIEIQEQGYLTGATTRYTFYALVFQIGCYLIYSLLRKRLRNQDDTIGFITNKKLVVSFYILILLILLFLLVTVLIYGSPLILGIGRTRYWQSIAPPGTKYLNSLLPQLSLLSGLFLTQIFQKKYKKGIYIIFSLTLITQILQGEKFSGLLLSSYFFFLPTLFFKYKSTNFKLSISFLFKLILTSLTSLLLVFLNYTLQLGDPLSGLLMIGNRLSLQGQVWWATDRLIGIKFDNIDFFVHQVLGFNTSEYNRGLNYLTKLIAPLVSQFYFATGSRFTAGYPSILLLGSGYLFGVPLVLMSSFIMGFTYYVLTLIIIRKKVMFTLISLKLFFASYLAFGMGDLFLIFSWKYIFFIIFSTIFYYLDIIIIRNKSTNITL